jgi:hypothetical protein
MENGSFEPPDESLVDQPFTTRNQMEDWLRRLDGLRLAA